MCITQILMHSTMQPVEVNMYIIAGVNAVLGNNEKIIFVICILF